MLLGLDIGTQSAKALVLTLEGTVYAEASVAYGVQSPQPGWAETDPQDWWQAAIAAIRQATHDCAGAIRAIALSGQMHGVVLVDAGGRPLRPAILWADCRSTAALADYLALPLDIQHRLANPVATGMAGVSLLWLRRAEPECYRAARWVLQPKDWVRWQMTGAIATDPSDASGTLMYDVLGDRWATDALDSLGLRTDWLPPILPSSGIAGALVPEVAETLGLSSEIPVIVGAADTAVATLGSGLLEPETVQLTVGTGAQILVLRTQPVSAAHHGLHLYRAAQSHLWYTLAAMQNAGLALEWVRSLLGLTWDEVYGAVAQVPAGCDGLIFLPYLTGERTPHLNPQARGAWIGLDLHHGRSHVMRAALEGVAFSIRQGLEALGQTGVTPRQMRLAGGGTQIAFWRQLLADILQVTLEPVEVSSVSARGAALLAGLGSACLAYPMAAPPTKPLIVPQPWNEALEQAWLQFCDSYPALYGGSPYE